MFVNVTFSEFNSTTVFACTNVSKCSYVISLHVQIVSKCSCVKNFICCSFIHGNFFFQIIPREINMADFLKSLKKNRSTVSTEEVQQFEAFTQDFGING